jgi:hypothetical protein
MTIIINHHDYNANLATSAKKLGGAWDSAEKHFVFENEMAKEKILALKQKWEGETVIVDIKATTNNYVSRGNLTFGGYTLAFGFGRDSGATLNHAHVQMLAGSVYTCGSAKNWDTECKKGSVFRLKIAKHLLKKAMESEKWEVALASENKFIDLNDDEEDDVI